MGNGQHLALIKVADPVVQLVTHGEYQDHYPHSGAGQGMAAGSGDESTGEGEQADQAGRTADRRLRAWFTARGAPITHHHQDGGSGQQNARQNRECCLQRPAQPTSQAQQAIGSNSGKAGARRLLALRPAALHADQQPQRQCQRHRNKRSLIQSG